MIFSQQHSTLKVFPLVTMVIVKSYSLLVQWLLSSFSQCMTDYTINPFQSGCWNLIFCMRLREYLQTHLQLKWWTLLTFFYWPTNWQCLTRKQKNKTTNPEWNGIMYDQTPRLQVVNMITMMGDTYVYIFGFLITMKCRIGKPQMWKEFHWWIFKMSLI